MINFILNIFKTKSTFHSRYHANNFDPEELKYTKWTKEKTQ